MKKFLLLLLAGALFASAAELRTIKDMDGAEVKIPAKVERIAALWHSNNQILLALVKLVYMLLLQPNSNQPYLLF